MASEIKMYFDSDAWKKGYNFAENHKHESAVRQIRFECKYLIGRIHREGHTLYTKDNYNRLRGCIDALYYTDCISLVEQDFYRNVAIMIWNCHDRTARNKTIIESNQKNTF